MKETRATPHGIRKKLVLRITHSPALHRSEKHRTALVVVEKTAGAALCITTLPPSDRRQGPGLYDVPPEFLGLLCDGDIVSLEPDGRLCLLWEARARQNALFITDHCNSRCIMCPQRPEAHPRHHDDTARQVLSLINPDGAPAFGITGGEPLLALEGLTSILELCSRRFPDAAVQLLTNGRRLADFDVVSKVAGSAPRRLLFCIPLYADNDVQHDAITGVRGSFRETIQGMHHLVRFRRPVEIRVVMVRQNSRRLRDLAHFIFWNFPFAAHVAFMAMETSGIASVNLNQVWVEPGDYSEELQKAVLFLHQRMINVSIYNLPLCLVPEKVRTFARDSISGWKKTFVPDCGPCARKDECGGFFATSQQTPAHVTPF